MQAKRKGVKKGVSEAQTQEQLEVKQLAASLMDEVRNRREADDRRATAFAQAAHQASGLLLLTFNPSLVKLRHELAKMVIFCTEQELDARPHTEPEGPAYCGPLTYLNGSPEGSGRLTITGRGGGGFRLGDEGVTWIRGHHAPDSADVKALRAAYEAAQKEARR